MRALRLLPLALACAVLPLAAAENVVARTSQSVAPVLEALKPAIAKVAPDLALTVSGCPTPASVKAVGEGEAQIGGIVRELKAEEKAAYPTLQAIPIARDGLALIVNAANPVANLSKDQTRDLLAGTVTNWKALGGPDTTILIVGRTEQNALNEQIEQKFGLEHLAEGTTMAFKVKGAAAFTATRFPVTGTHKDALAQVILKENAFSFIPLALASESAKKSGKIRILAIDGFSPDAENIASGKYLLGRVLYLVTKGEPAGAVKTVVDTALSPEGQALIVGLGNFPVR